MQGGILGATSLAYLCASPAWGMLLLRLRCRRVLLWGLALSALGSLLFAAASTVVGLGLARVITGVGNASAEVRSAL